jgi:hypothetical protein
VSGCAPIAQCFLHVQLYLDGSAAPSHSTPLFLDTFTAQLPYMPRPNVKVSSPVQTSPAGTAFSMSVTSDAVSAYTYLESGSIVGVFSPNAFLILPGQSVDVTFTSRSPTTAQQLGAAMSVKSLSNVLATLNS